MAENIDSPEFWSLENNCSSGSSLNNYSMCNVCRLCASISDNVVPIFDQVNEKGNIYTKLKKCLPSITVRITFHVLYFSVQLFNSIYIVFLLYLGTRK